MTNVTLIILLLGLVAASDALLNKCHRKVDGTRLAHPTDCTKFIVCGGHQIASISSCPAGLHFNRHLGECDFKAVAGCAWYSPRDESECVCDPNCCDCCSTAPSPGTPSPGTQSPGTSSPTTTPVTPSPGTPSPGTPSPGTPSPATPTPGTPTPGTPSPGTPTPGTPSPGTPSPGTPSPGTPSPGTPSPGTQTPGPGGCPNDITICLDQPDNSRHAYEGYCDKWIVCVGGCGHVLTCPDGLYWQQRPNVDYADTDYCDYPENLNPPCPWATPSPGTPSPGTPSPSTQSPGTPSPGTPSPGTPSPSTPSPGTPSPGTQSPGTSSPTTTPVTPSPGTPSPGTPSPGTPSPATPTPGTPTPGTPSPGTPSPGTPSPGTPSPSTPSPGTPSPGTQSPGTSSPTTTPVTPSPGTPSPGTPSPGTPSPGTQTPGPGGCPNDITICVDQPDNSRHAYEGYCDKWIVCVGGCGHVLTCPDGLYWQQRPNVDYADTDYCDYPQNLNPPCPWATPSPGTTSPGTPSPSTQSPGTPSPGTPSPGTPSPGTPSPSTPSPGTPSPGTPSPGTPSPSTPSQGTPSPGTLSPGTTTPVTPSPGTPSPPTPSPSTPSPPTPSPPTPSPPTPSPPTPTPGPGGCSNSLTVCVNQPDNSSHAYEGYCNKWITCQGGCSIIKTCPNNLQWVQKPNGEYGDGDYCDFPENIDPPCPWPTEPPSTGPSGISCEDQGPCAGAREGQKFGDPSNTNNFITCQCECPIYQKCPGGLLWNQTALSCDWPQGHGTDPEQNVKCDNNSTICKNQEEGSLWPMDKVCGKFYKCNYGCAVPQDCPSGLHYDSKAEVCDYVNNVKCPWPYTPPSGPNAGPSGISCPSGGRCVGQAEGTYFTSNTSCRKYVVCQCECEREMDCPGGTYWNQKTNMCDYAGAVDCAMSYDSKL